MTNKDKIKIAALIASLLFLAKKTVTKTKQVMSNIKSKQDFINLIYPSAKAIGNKIGVPPLFLLSQIIVETGWGKSELFKKHFNVGGVKAVKGQKFVTYPTFEYIKGKKVRIPQNFASYESLADGLAGYAKIFQNRYFRQHLNKTTDPKQYASLLQSGKVKYATDINYVPKMHKLIDTLKPLVS